MVLGQTTLPNQLFTVEAMTTFAGATGITAAIANGIQKAFDFNPKWLALAIAQLVCLVGAWQAGTSGCASYFVAAANGFLVYLAAAGGTSAASAALGGTGATPARSRRGILTPWF